MSIGLLSGIFGNMGSVVGVVIMNKYIVSVDGFNFMVFLSFCHFVFTYMGTMLLLKLRVFQYKEAKISDVLPVALGALGSVCFMNLNLAYNSVGFYQLSKLGCVPTVIAIEYMAFGKTVPWRVLVTLIPIVLGVGIATVSDVQVNFVGSCMAVAAVVCTSLAQIFTSKFQKELNCNALQLLCHTAPLIAGGMLLMTPVFDSVSQLRVFPMTAEVLAHIILTCFFALGVNISNYLVLGKTSPLTYQVLGHAKTILILTLGFVVFNVQPTQRSFVGILVALGGVVAYTETKRRITEEAAKTVETIVQDEELELIDHCSG